MSKRKSDGQVAAPRPVAESEAEESLRLIAAAEREVGEAEDDMLKAKDLAKSKTKTWEAKVANLRQVVRDRSTPLPLFARPGPAPEPGEAPGPDGDPDAWRSHPIAALDVDAAILGKLSAAGLATLGDLESRLESGGPLAEIPGLGPRDEEAILGALGRRRAALAGPTADGEATPADPPRQRRRRKAEGVAP